MPTEPNPLSPADVTHAGGVPPPLPPAPEREFCRQLLAVLLSLGLGLFLVDAAVSVADDTLILSLGAHPLSLLRGVMSTLALLMSLGVYVLMGLTPMVPKRLFLPLSLFAPTALLALYPVAIYCYHQMLVAVLVLSVVQFLLGLGLLRSAQGRVQFGWPLVPVSRLNPRCFSWLNLGGFAVANVLVLLPAMIAYLLVCSVLAIDHFSGGFMALHAGGLSVKVKTYVRDDGKTVELFPMSHVADAGFYREVSRTFPTNSIILMEGVTDRQHLLTNRITYRRMARSLGLAEQQEKFVPSRGQRVRADVDVSQFSATTIEVLNLITLIHARGVTPENVLKLLQYAPPPGLEDQLLKDLLGKRNERLLAEIQSHLTQADHLMVPWGVAHMPGIAEGLQAAGFHVNESRDYPVIQFRRAAKHRAEPGS